MAQVRAMYQALLLLTAELHRLQNRLSHVASDGLHSIYPFAAAANCCNAMCTVRKKHWWLANTPLVQQTTLPLHLNGLQHRPTSTWKCGHDALRCFCHPHPATAALRGRGSRHPLGKDPSLTQSAAHASRCGIAPCRRTRRVAEEAALPQGSCPHQPARCGLYAETLPALCYSSGGTSRVFAEPRALRGALRPVRDSSHAAVSISN